MYKKIMSDTPLEVVLTTDKELLTKQRNNFQTQLVNNALDLTRHLQIQESDPEFQRQNAQGKFMGIGEIVENYKKSVQAAKAYVEIIDAMLKADEAGELGEAIAELATEAKEEESAE